MNWFVSFGVFLAIVILTADSRHAKTHIISPPLIDKPKDANLPMIQCVDENNLPVDWVIFYKLPRVHGSLNPLIANGEAYMYVSSEDVKRFEKKRKTTKNNFENKEKSKNKSIQEGTYYNYNTTRESLVGKVRDVLVQEFVKNAKDQIEEIDKEEIEREAELVASELDGGSGKRKVKRDANQEDPEINNDPSLNVIETNEEKNNIYVKKNPDSDIHDSIRFFNDLLQARKSRNKQTNGKHSLDNEDVGANHETILDIIRAIELLNGNVAEDDDYSEDFDKSNEMNIGDISSQDADSYIRENGMHENAQSADDNMEKLADSVENESGEIDGLNAKRDSTLKNDGVWSQHILSQKKSSVNNIAGKGASQEIPSSDEVHWTLSTFSVRDPRSLPGKILSPLLFNESFFPAFTRDGMKILYNDQTPNSTTVKFGHSKGLVVGNSGGGIWIVHSVPHFVDDSQKDYSYPHTGLMYGQNFLCISLNASDLDNVGNNLGHNQIYKYSTFMSDGNLKRYPTLASVIAGTYKPNADNFYRSTIATRFGGVRFSTFAKTRELGQDLYKYIASGLSEPLLVETWPNGPGRLSSDCKQPGKEVENVAGINASSVVAFRSTHDHAKWAISFRTEPKISESKKIVFGNREASFDETSSRKTGKIGRSYFTEEGIYETLMGEKLQNELAISKGLFVKGISSDGNRMDNDIHPIGEVNHVNEEDLMAEESDGDEGIVNYELKNLDDFDSNMDSLDTYADDTNVENKNQDIISITKRNANENMPTTKRNSAKRTNQNSRAHRLSFGSQDGIKDLNCDSEFDKCVLALIGDSAEDRVTRLSDHSKVSNEHPDATKQASSKNSRSDSNFSPQSEDSSSLGDDFKFFVCNGDINRAEDQLKRGGGSVCLENEVVWKLYRSLVSQVEPCPRN